MAAIIPTTTTGDLIYADTTVSPSNLKRRAIGNPGDVLTVAGGEPTWAAPGAGSGDVVGDDATTASQNIVAYNSVDGKHITELTGTQGDVLYHNGTVWSKLGAGTSGHFLKTQGAGANPVWAAGGGGEAFPVGSVFIAVVSTNPGTLLGYGTWSAFGTGRMLIGIDSGDTDFDVVEETGGAKTHTLATANLAAHSHGVTDPTHTHVATDLGHTHNIDDPGHIHTTQRYPTTTGASSGFTRDASMSGTLADNTLPVKIATTGITVVSTSTSISVDSSSTGISIDNTGSGTAVNHMPPYIAVYMWKRTV